LTPREQEVALLAKRKLTNGEIARTSGIKRGTVKVHVHNILKKVSRVVGHANRRRAPRPPLIETGSGKLSAGNVGVPLDLPTTPNLLSESAHHRERFHLVGKLHACEEEPEDEEDEKDEDQDEELPVVREPEE
jgi:hypothetical protein